MLAGPQFGIVSHKLAAATVEMNYRAMIATTKFAANFCEAGLRLRYVPYDHDAYGTGPGEFLPPRRPKWIPGFSSGRASPFYALLVVSSSGSTAQRPSSRPDLHAPRQRAQ